MKDIVIKLQAAADDLWSKIMDLEYEKETIKHRQYIWEGYSSDDALLNQQELSEELRATQDSQDMLMHSYSVIMFKISEICKRENVQSATGKDQ